MEHDKNLNALPVFGRGPVDGDIYTPPDLSDDFWDRVDAAYSEYKERAQ